MRQRRYTIIFLTLISSIAFTPDTIDEIAGVISSGNSKSLSGYFIDNIDLKIIDKEDIYSKQQAEMILKDFFSKHLVKAFSIVHKSEPKGGSQYVIGALDTSNGKFRTYFLIKNTGGKSLIQQFRIENE